MRKLIIFALLAGTIFLNKEGYAETMKTNYEKVAFAGGCFWGVEKIFAEVDGVVETQVGYTGGTGVNPIYEWVCTGQTGHAEAVEITYDPSKTSFEKLLETFFSYHDPTTMNRQGPDKGSQYRSAIYYHTPEQKEKALHAIHLLEKEKVFKSKIVTQVEPAGKFYRAEEYHQKYLKKNPGGYCSHHFQSAKIAEVLRTAKNN